MCIILVREAADMTTEQVILIENGTIITMNDDGKVYQTVSGFRITSSDRALTIPVYSQIEPGYPPGGSNPA